MSGLDAVVFTAGVGEHSAPVRARVAEKLGWLGVTLDAAANRAKATRISAADSRVPVFVIPTDEERMIASHTLAGDCQEFRVRAGCDQASVNRSSKRMAS